MVKNTLADYKFYTKHQLLQYHEITCIGWIHCYTNKVDCTGLEAYLTLRVSKLIKQPAQLAYSFKTVFTGLSQSQEEQSYTIKKQQ